MARYDLVQEPHRLTFRISRPVYAHRLRYLFVCLGFCALTQWAITHPAVHRAPPRDALTDLFFFGLLALILGVLILITLVQLVTGGAVYVLDRSKHLLERNGKPLCVLAQLHHVELRLGFVLRSNRYGTDRSSLIVSLVLGNGREIVVDQTQNQAEAAALAEQIATFAGVPFGNLPMPSPGNSP
jgi:hypothetical protein